MTAPKRDRAAYMREYRARQRAADDDSADTGAPFALDSPDADWRRLPPVDALVRLARALPDESPLDGADVLPSPPGALAAADARWRTFAPRVAFAVLTDCTAATLGTD